MVRSSKKPRGPDTVHELLQQNKAFMLKRRTVVLDVADISKKYQICHFSRSDHKTPTIQSVFMPIVIYSVETG